MRRRSMRSVPYQSAVFGLVDEDAAAGDHRAQHAALDGPAVVRRVLRFGTQGVDVNAPRPLEIKNSEVGGSADLDAPGGQPQYLRRPLRQRLQHLEQRHM